MKRVIGLPGDRVKVVDQQVFVNGKRLNEPYAVHNPAFSYDPFRDNFPPRSRADLEPGIQSEWADDMFNYIHDGEVVVPAGKYFAMGDNRENSADSRYWGFVDRDAILGRPLFIYWSVEGEEGNSWFYGLVDTLLHLPSRTRWSRKTRDSMVATNRARWSAKS